MNISNKKYTVSFLVVSYNKKETIDNAIKSILIQKNVDYEIIIGDDGSNDGSIEIIKTLKNQNREITNVFIMERKDTIHEDNIISSIRASNLIKKGLSLCKGKYIKILSADDIFVGDNVLKKQVDQLNEDVNKCYSTSICNFIMKDDKEEKEIKAKKSSFKKYWSLREYMHISCFLFRREVFEQGFLLDRFCDDIGMEYSIGLFGEYAYIDEMGFIYNINGTSITKSIDMNEMYMIEMLMFQDILNKKNSLRNIEYSRTLYNYLLLILNKKDIKSNKYLKYYEESQKYNNDILYFINKNGVVNNIKSYAFCLKLFFYRIYYRIISTLYILR